MQPVFEGKPDENVAADLDLSVRLLRLHLQALAKDLTAAGAAPKAGRRSGLVAAPTAVREAMVATLGQLEETLGSFILGPGPRRCPTCHRPFGVSHE